MNKDITYVALDAHKKQHRVAMVLPGEREAVEWTVNNEFLLWKGRFCRHVSALVHVRVVFAGRFDLAVLICVHFACRRRDFGRTLSTMRHPSNMQLVRTATFASARPGCGRRPRSRCSTRNS